MSNSAGLVKYDPDQHRGNDGKWSSGGGSGDFGSSDAARSAASATARAHDTQIAGERSSELHRVAGRQHLIAAHVENEQGNERAALTHSSWGKYHLRTSRAPESKSTEDFGKSPVAVGAAAATAATHDAQIAGQPSSDLHRAAARQHYAAAAQEGQAANDKSAFSHSSYGDYHLMMANRLAERSRDSKAKKSANRPGSEPGESVWDMAKAPARHKLTLSKLEFLSLVDRPAQGPATVRLIKRANDGDEVEVKAIARVVKVSEGDDPLIYAWAFQCVGEDGNPYSDLQGDEIQPDFVKAAEDFMRSGGAVDRMHEGSKTSHVAFAFPMDSEVAKAMFGAPGEAIKTVGLMTAIRPSAEDLAGVRAGRYTGVSIAGTGVREALKSAAPACPSCGAYGKAADEVCKSCGEAMKRDVTKFNPDQDRDDHGRFGSGGGGGSHGGGGGGGGGGKGSDKAKEASAAADKASRIAGARPSPETHAAARAAHAEAAFAHSAAGNNAGHEAHMAQSREHRAAGMTIEANRASVRANSSGSTREDHIKAAIAHQDVSDLHAYHGDSAKAKRHQDEAAHHETMARMPRTRKRAVSKQVVLTSSEAGHQHQIDLDDPADGWSDQLTTSLNTAEGADQGHVHAWIFDPATGAITIAEDSGHSHTVDAVVPADVLAEAALRESGERCSGCGQMCESDARYCPNCGRAMSRDSAVPAVISDDDDKPAPAVVVISARAPESISTPSDATPTVKGDKEPTAMADPNDRIKTLEGENAQLKKMVSLTDAQRAHFSKLDETDQINWLNMNGSQRDAVLADIAKADEVVYESPFTKRVYRKSHALEIVEAAREADASKAALEQLNIAKRELEYSKRGETILKNWPMGAKRDLRSRFMKAIDLEFKDAAEHEEAVKALKASDFAIEQLTVAKGVNPHNDPSDTPLTPKAQLELLTAEYAKSHNVPIHKAATAVLETPAGAALYAKLPVGHA